MGGFCVFYIDSKREQQVSDGQKGKKGENGGYEKVTAVLVCVCVCASE